MGNFTRFLFQRSNAQSDAPPNANPKAVFTMLANSRVSLAISFDKGGDKVFSAYVLLFENTKDKCYLLIDELTPKGGNRLMKKGTALQAVCKRRGVKYTFKSKVIGVGSSKDSTYFALSLPDSIDVKEARKSYRVAVTAPAFINAEIVSKGRGVVKGSVADISAEGIGLNISGVVEPVLMMDEKLDSVFLKVDKQTIIEVSVIVKHILFSSMDRSTYVGCSIDSFKKQSEKSYEKLYARLQREEQRKSAATKGKR